MNTPRAKMLHYMQSLRTQVGYVSIKTKYTELQARNFRSLPGFDTDIANTMEENVDAEEYLVPSNPLEEKDRRIATLEMNLESLKNKESEIVELKRDLAQSKSDHLISLKKIDFTQKGTDQSLFDCISNPDEFKADPAVIVVHSATLDETVFDVEDSLYKNDSKEDSGRSRKDIFLRSLEEKVDPSNNDQKERFKDIKNLILEKVKLTHASRTRSRSRSNKRSLSDESLLSEHGKSPIRPRTKTPDEH